MIKLIPRIKLIACNKEALEAAIKGDESLKNFLKINIADKWTEFGVQAFSYAYDKLSDNPDEEGWWTYLPILESENMLIGTCGYKGKPDENGIVEIGYEVAESYRNKGLATEIAQQLITKAFANQNVKTVQAHTLAEENSSVKVLQKCKMLKIEEINDPDDGKLWKWEIRK